MEDPTRYYSTWGNRRMCKILTLAVGIFILLHLIEMGMLIRLTTSSTTAPTSPNVTKLIMVTRQEWGAKPPTNATNPMKLPVPYVIVEQTITDPCFTEEDCIKIVRGIQKFHMDDKKFLDIGYNFLVGGDGRAYEGRGSLSQGAHIRVRPGNSQSYGIAMIGRFTKDHGTEDQLLAARELIKSRERYLTTDYKVLSQNQLDNLLPSTLDEEVKKWSHWSPSL